MTIKIKYVTCMKCHGSGGNMTESCATCNGAGKIVMSEEQVSSINLPVAVVGSRTLDGEI